MDYLGNHHDDPSSLEYDNLDQILEDVPRSTSAPPSLEELQNALANGTDPSPFVLVHEDEVSMKPFTDIRLDEDYEEFYKHYAGAKKLPPPVENRQPYGFSPTAGTLFHTPFSNGFDSDSNYLNHNGGGNVHHHRSRSGLPDFSQEERKRQINRLEDRESGISAAFSRMNLVESNGVGTKKVTFSPGLESSDRFQDDSRFRTVAENEAVLETSKSDSFGHSQRPTRRPMSSYGLGSRSLSMGSREAFFETALELEGENGLDGYGTELFNPMLGGRAPNHIIPAEYELAALKQAQRTQHLAAMQLQRQQQQHQEQLVQLEQERVRSQLQQQQMMMMMMIQQGQDVVPNSRAGARFNAPAGMRRTHQRLPPSHNRGHSFQLDSRDWTLPGAPAPAPAPAQTAHQPMMGVCPFYLQGYCGRGTSCPFMHSIPQIANMASGRRESAAPTQADSTWIPQVGYESTTGGHGAYPIPTSNGQSRRKGDGSPVAGKNGTIFDDLSSGASGKKESPPASGTSPVVSNSLKYNTLEDVEGRIFTIAKDQHGCRFLQRKFDEGGATEVAKIYGEIRSHILELMTDPFGNYLIQKLLEVCSSDQRLDILKQVTERSDLISISLNMHGTRAVQKLIETIEGTLQIKMVIASLRPGVVALIKDLNGNHVIQRCLQKLSTEDSQFIFDAAASHCIEIATHRHGCCVLQRCIDFSTGVQRERLVREIASNALVLGQDPFGNYVVQYILDLNLDWAAIEVMERLQGQYAVLAQQKFSSNVVEKCLKLAGEEHRTIIINEIISCPRFSQLLQDPFANYVFQSALSVSKGGLHNALVEAIRPHTQVLKSSPYGKRILARVNVRK